MEEYDISLSDVTEKVEMNNVNAGGSMLSRGDLSYVIRGIGLDVYKRQEYGCMVYPL